MSNSNPNEGINLTTAGPITFQGSSISNQVTSSVVYDYDFAVDGGAQGTIILRNGPTIPSGSFVAYAYWETITNLGSAGSATVALTTGESANDIQTAVAFNNAALLAGMHVNASVNKKTTAARQPSIVIAAADLNAGKVRLHLGVTYGW